MSIVADTARHLNAMARDSAFEMGFLLRKLGITQRQLERIIKKNFGCTAEHWLLEERLKASPALLLRQSSVKRVAGDLGFKQASHFSRAFKGHFGVSPKEYRKKVLREPLWPRCPNNLPRVAAGDRRESCKAPVRILERL